MKKNWKNISLQVILTILIALAIAGGIQIMRSQQILEPDNPIQGISEKRSHDLSVEETDFKLEADTYDAVMSATSLIQENPKDEAAREQAEATGENSEFSEDGEPSAEMENGAAGSDTTGNSSDAADGNAGENGDGSGTTGGNGGGVGELDETDLAYFTTSIIDGETVTNPEYEFTIRHLNKNLTVKGVYVYLNGKLDLQFDGAVTLSEGKNNIRISVRYQDEKGKYINVFKLYKVYLGNKDDADDSKEEEEVKPDDIRITTSISDGMEVSEREFTFTATAEDSSGKTYPVTAVLNGSTIKDHSGSEYHCYLNKKKNTIRLRVSLKDGKKAEWIYHVYYIPETTPETAPVIITNLTDGMVSNTSGYTLDISANDYEGNRIYYNNLTVKLNGTSLYYSWATDELTSYWLELETGDNTVSIRAEDEAGRYTEQVYHITYTPADANVPIGSIQVSVEAGTVGLGTLIAPQEIPIYADVPFSYYFVSLMDNNGFTYVNAGSVDQGFYLRSIGKPGFAASAAVPEDLRAQIDIDGLMWMGNESSDSLGEHDYTQGSGWMYSVNGKYCNYSMSDYHPQNGDVVRIRYTLANGKDIGGYTSTGTGNGNINSNYAKEW